MKDDSLCPKSFLCAFEESRNLPDAVVEICVRCGKKVIYNKGKNGRIDNKKYLRDHRRDFIQPYGEDKKLFIKLWGYKGIETAQRFVGKKKNKVLLKEQRQLLKEKRIWMREKAFRGLGKSKAELTPPKYIKTTGFQKFG